VVALESAVITCGLPREPYELPEKLRDVDPQWDATQPLNLEVARAMSRAVPDGGAGGAVPAIVCVSDGHLRIGLDDRELAAFARDSKAGKCSSTDLSAAILSGQSYGTTVSATLTACSLTHQNNSNHGIRFFATGGIGGVHREWNQHPDISADLRALASNPVCVVSSGAKSILDLPATLEALQMLGVPVAGYQTQWFPQFYSRGEPANAPAKSASNATHLTLNSCVKNPDDAARLCRIHWDDLHFNSSVLIVNPIPREHAVDDLEIELAVAEAERLARHKHIAGSQRTPFLLAEMARLTEGRSLAANIALLVNNAKLAARIACAAAQNQQDRPARTA
jgi:pseudouridine-5'-phosphate glycosidase